MQQQQQQQYHHLYHTRVLIIIIMVKLLSGRCIVYFKISIKLFITNPFLVMTLSIFWLIVAYNFHFFFLNSQSQHTGALYAVCLFDSILLI